MKNFFFPICYVAGLGLAAQYSIFGATPPPVTVQQASRLLDQAAWGPTAKDIGTVQAQGLSGWIDAQFTAAPSDLPDQPVLDSMGRINNNVAPIRSAFFVNTVTGPDQLRQRIAFILSQIWVVSQQSGTTPAYAYPPLMRIFRDHAFGTYADIIKAVTLSPAMGRYLNMANNNKGNATRSANENYGRELMQLFTLGLTQLNADGSFVIDPVTHAPASTYTEAEVSDLAKALTGWTYPTAPGVAAKLNNPEYYFGPMFAVPVNHDITKKVLFGGYTIPANQTAEMDLDSVIKGLMQQPTMAPFICRQLIEHLVTSNPSPAYLQRVSAVFGNTGDMKAVIKAILLDAEARAGDSDPLAFLTGGHLREPVLLMANLLRGLNATTGPLNNIGGYTSLLGENIFDANSVFSYFSPASRTEKGLYGPEFQIYSTQSSTYRANTIYTAIYGALDGATKVDLTPFNAKAGSKTVIADVVGAINLVFLHNQASANLLSAMTNAAQAASTANAVRSALFVALTSAEYQVIH